MDKQFFRGSAPGYSHRGLCCKRSPWCQCELHIGHGFGNCEVEVIKYWFASLYIVSYWIEKLRAIQLLEVGGGVDGWVGGWVDG